MSSMDFTLRCNSLKCRAQLTERALVTTCSHIFCMSCADQLGLSNAAGGHRACPACHTALTNPDDAVSTYLNPTEDYKTSVLSGLSPTAIMECAGRGLAFWAYQSTQEIIYQEYLAKSLTDKYGKLNMEVDRIINEANAEIDTLTERLGQMKMEQEKLEMDKSNLASALREKTRKHNQLYELYDRIKRKEMTAKTQSAAFDTADDVLHSAMGLPHEQASRYDLGVANDSHRRAGSDGSAGRSRMMAPPPRPTNFGNPSLRARGEGLATPSQHRQALGGSGPSGIPVPEPGRGGAGAGYGSQRYLHTPSLRRPVTNGSGNTVGRGGTGYGLSAGMRTGSTHKGYSSAGGYV